MLLFLFCFYLFLLKKNVPYFRDICVGRIMYIVNSDVTEMRVITHTEEHFIVYYNNASDYKNIQSINEYYTEISEI